MYQVSNHGQGKEKEVWPSSKLQHVHKDFLDTPEEKRKNETLNSISARHEPFILEFYQWIKY